MAEKDIDNITTEMMEHICDNICRYPVMGLGDVELEDICAECKMDQYVCDIINNSNHQEFYEELAGYTFGGEKLYVKGGVMKNEID